MVEEEGAVADTWVSLYELTYDDRQNRLSVAAGDPTPTTVFDEADRLMAL